MTEDAHAQELQDKAKKKKTATAAQITKEEQYPNWLMAIKNSSKKSWSSKAPSSILQKRPILNIQTEQNST